MAKQMTDRVNKIGAVHRVEMEIGDAAVDEAEHLLRGDRRGDQTPGRGIIIQSFEAIGEPLRHAGAGALGEIGGLLEILHRHNAGNDRDRHAAITRAIEKAQIAVVLEEELRDGARRARIDLRFQHVDVEVERSRFRVFFGICGHRDFELADAPDTGNELG